MTVEMHLARDPVERLEADALVVGAFSDDLSAAARAVDTVLGGLLAEMRERRELTGRFGEVVVVPTMGRLRVGRVAVLGLGDPAKLDSFRITNGYHFAGRQLRRRDCPRVALALEAAVSDSLGDASAAMRASVTGLLLANLEPVFSRDPVAAEISHILLTDADEVEDAPAEFERGRVLAEATNITRRWAALPANRLTPRLFADQVSELLGTTSGVEVDVVAEERLRHAGAGGLLGVAQGSHEPPVLITARYRGGAEGDPVLGLVGKGVTFDSGGISIKPAAGMELMRFDMAGGAAVIAALWAIASLRLACNVVAVVPATENLPSGSALKPGDVITIMDGTTVEVVNTDAEGRLILADGLSWARQMGATHLVDVATLTGAAIVALGHVTSALYSSSLRLGGAIHEAAALAGERADDMPMRPEYATVLRSDSAQLVNSAGREAGSVTAAFFLRHFAHDLPWAHLDVAGSAWNSQGKLTEIPKGASGAPVRTLVELARLISQGGRLS